MAKKQFRLILKSGPDHLRRFTENASESFKRGDIVKMTGSGATADVTKITAEVETGILGVAAIDGQNVAAPPNDANVYVIAPDQVWELHVQTNKKPNTAYTIGANYKVDWISSTNYTITRDAETASTTISVVGPILETTTATAGTGLVLLGYSDDATKAKKGQKVLVRFADHATVAY